MISEGQAELITSYVLNEEINAALFDIGDDKSPSLDGYTACFYKKSWGIIGDLFCRAIQEFFDSGVY